MYVDKELERKAKKATRWKGKIWTIEEIRFGESKAKIMAEIFEKGRYEAVILCLQNLIQKKMMNL